MIKKYNDFKEDFLLESLLLESKVEFSKRLMNLFLILKPTMIHTLEKTYGMTGNLGAIMQKLIQILAMTIKQVMHMGRNFKKSA